METINYSDNSDKDLQDKIFNNINSTNVRKSRVEKYADEKNQMLPQLLADFNYGEVNNYFPDNVDQTTSKIIQLNQIEGYWKIDQLLIEEIKASKLF
jgi:hypothetical protein